MNDVVVSISMRQQQQCSSNEIHSFVVVLGEESGDR
jgi:hypothetical protein